MMKDRTGNTPKFQEKQAVEDILKANGVSVSTKAYDAPYIMAMAAQTTSAVLWPPTSMTLGMTPDGEDSAYQPET